MRKTLFSALAALWAVAFAGCSFNMIKPGTTITPDAAIAIEALQARNSGLKSSKGIGNVSISTAKGKNSMRIAWICLLPEEARIEIIAPGGLPAMTISTDGTNSYLLQHSGCSSLRKVKNKRIKLDELIGIPLGIESLPQLLNGSIPLSKHNAALVDCDQGKTCALVLKRRWHGVVEKVYFEKESKRPLAAEFFDGSGDIPSCSIEFLNFKAVGDFELPGVIVFKSQNGAKGSLEIVRFYPNADVDEDAFVLEPCGDGNTDK